MHKIDVIIPVVEKDLDVLPYAVDSVRKHVRHPIGEIMIIAPESKKIKKMSKAKNCSFIEENSVLPFSKKDLKYTPKKNGVAVDRSGWLFQQFLKLNGDSLGACEGFLVLDADTVLIRSHIFEQGGKSILFSRTLHYQPYFTTYTRLMGEKALGPALSLYFVSHYMFFQKKYLAEMKNFLEARHKTDWYSAILKSMNKSQWDSFSEYETYGNFLLKNYPQKIVVKPRCNLGLKRSSIKNIERIDFEGLAQKHQIRSVSFHSWND